MHRIKTTLSGDLIMLRPLIPLSPNVLSVWIACKIIWVSASSCRVSNTWTNPTGYAISPEMAQFYRRPTDSWLEKVSCSRCQQTSIAKISWRIAWILCKIIRVSASSCVQYDSWQSETPSLQIFLAMIRSTSKIQNFPGWHLMHLVFSLLLWQIYWF
jgi:hypothetical protein